MVGYGDYFLDNYDSNLYFLLILTPNLGAVIAPEIASNILKNPEKKISFFVK